MSRNQEFNKHIGPFDIKGSLDKQTGHIEGAFGIDMGPVGYQKVKSFSGSYTEGISTDISIHLFGTHKFGSFTIKGENGAVVVLLAWDGETHRITLLEAEKQAEGSLDLHFTYREPKGTLTFTADGSKITRQLTFMPGPAAQTSLEVAVPVTVIYHDAATLKQPNLTFTGAVIVDGAAMIYVTFSSGVEARGRIPRERIQDSDTKIWPGSLEGTAP
ncbi:hypothetical protein BDV26DRAFT_275336 [Aspergillus bertholletiae]|uniref:Uncharacterized protein n=1 Tax=Aspergillus bertholletiae TaxID=1226010 RepID=A0A5N7APN5_9EURO|nr:hypothetical protein BDV26DRAFT_275336 [Aspergillus bertholletiae]